MIEYVKDIRGTPCPFCGGKRQFVMCRPTNIEFNGSPCVKVEVCCHMCGARVDSFDVDRARADVTKIDVERIREITKAIIEDGLRQYFGSSKKEE